MYSFVYLLLDKKEALETGQNEVAYYTVACHEKTNITPVYIIQYMSQGRSDSIL